MYVFFRIDVNKNQSIEVQELKNWVQQKTKEHFEEARHESKEKFHKFDLDKDGILTWNEYLVEFLVAKGFNR